MGFSFGKPAGLSGSEFFLVHRSFIKHVCFNINPLRELHQSISTLEEISFVRQAVLAHCVSRVYLSMQKREFCVELNEIGRHFGLKFVDFQKCCARLQVL